MKPRLSNMAVERDGDAGFTLIELLIAMVLIALALALMPGTMRLARQAWLAQERLDSVHEAEAGIEFLTSRLELAQPIFEPKSEAGRFLEFVGTAEKISFIAAMPLSAPLRGLYRFDVHVEPASQAKRNLVVTYRSYSEPDETEKPAERRVLLEDLSGFNLRYLATSSQASGPRSWRADWQRQDRLPGLIELSWSTGRSNSTRRRTAVITPRLRRD